MADVTVTLDVHVYDPKQLWCAALAHLVGSGIDMDDAKSTLGTEDDPDLGACLRMLIDPGESPPGCSIQDSSSEEYFARAA